MKSCALLLILACLTSFADNTNEVRQDTTDLERDARALELFLQDRKDHNEYCPSIQWDQPRISVYKETLASQLPVGCKT